VRREREESPDPCAATNPLCPSGEERAVRFLVDWQSRSGLWRGTEEWRPLCASGIINRVPLSPLLRRRTARGPSSRPSPSHPRLARSVAAVSFFLFPFLSFSFLFRFFSISFFYFCGVSFLLGGVYVSYMRGFPSGPRGYSHVGIYLTPS
jgi:hypothetical protein